MEPVTLRGMERILAVIIGGLCIYLGYRLFFHIKEQKEGEANLKLPAGISIFITRVGPGVFFALFGALVVSLSFYQSIVYFNEKPAGGTEFYGGFTTRDSANEPDMLEHDRLKLMIELEFLNRLPPMLKDLNSEERREVEPRITSTKVKLMRTVWSAEWGDFDEFIWWAESGATDPVPSGLEAAATYYRSGAGGLK